MLLWKQCHLLKFKVDAASRLCAGCIEQYKELDFNLKNKSEKVKSGGWRGELKGFLLTAGGSVRNKREKYEKWEKLRLA